MWRNKYHAKKIATEDGLFDSKKEYKRWLQLKEMHANGSITELQRQVRFELLPKQVLIEPRTKKKSKQRCELPVSYIADFVYKAHGDLIVEDVKGMRTPEYVLKRKLMKFLLDIEIVEV